MRNQKLWALVLTPLHIILFSCFLHAEELTLTPEQHANEIQAGLKNFKALKITSLDETVEFNIQLGTDSLTLSDGSVYNGLRFTLPQDYSGQDFIWYFNTPKDWCHWYLYPAQGAVKQSFKDWLEADLVYATYDNVDEKNRFRCLQTCSGAYFQAGHEYIIWFHKVGQANTGQLKGVLKFAPSDPDGWEHETLEKSLKLKKQNYAAQVKQLESVGGQILLDKQLFQAAYANERIESLITSIRSSKSMPGGFFISMRTFVPPCKDGPTLAQIENKYGKAHFVQSHNEFKQVMGIDEEDNTPDKTIYYYDYFGFEVLDDDKNRRVQRVSTQEDNFAVLLSNSEEPTAIAIRKKNLTVFKHNDVELGRIYFFMESGKAPIVIKEPALKTYLQDGQAFEYKGDGNWELRFLFDDGKTHQIMHMVQHKFHGVSKRFYNNGAIEYQVEYKDGLLDGKLEHFSKDGALLKTRTFKAGEEQ